MGKVVVTILALLVLAAIIYVVENSSQYQQKPDWGIAKDSPVRK